jgi:prepilin-type N-terminal cleavage/methylation domain-containing protein
VVFKKAFTMIELIFVIVILGILAKYGVELLAQSYNTFIYTKINNELQAKSNYAVEFIAKRLQSRIPSSVIKRQSAAAGQPYRGVTEIVPNPAAFNVLEWIAYDIDGFRGTANVPLWSGIIDFDPLTTTINQLTSPNTNTDNENTLIQNLSFGGSTIADAAIMFNDANHNPQSFGWDGGPAIVDQTQSMHPINGTILGGNIFIPNVALLDNFQGVQIFNRYMLAWTAYAIVFNTATNQLTLHFDYQPWWGESLANAPQQRVIMDDVSEFRIRPSSDGRVFSIRVCVKSNQTNQDHALCKEKTVF